VVGRRPDSIIQSMTKNPRIQDLSSVFLFSRQWRNLHLPWPDLRIQSRLIRWTLADKARLNIAKPQSHNRRPCDLRLFEIFTLILTLTPSRFSRPSYHSVLLYTHNVGLPLRPAAALSYRLSRPDDRGGRTALAGPSQSPAT
jgi:hypothetical protein